jgi:hypothetical protein
MLSFPQKTLESGGGDQDVVEVVGAARCNIADVIYIRDRVVGLAGTAV